MTFFYKNLFFLKQMDSFTSVLMHIKWSLKSRFSRARLLCNSIWKRKAEQENSKYTMSIVWIICFGVCLFWNQMQKQMIQTQDRKTNICSFMKYLRKNIIIVGRFNKRISLFFHHWYILAENCKKEIILKFIYLSSTTVKMRCWENQMPWV